MIPGIIAGAAANEPPVDPLWANVVSVINDFGADGTTNWTDAKGHTWTPAGGAVVERDNVNFPEGAITHNGTNAYVDGDSSADWTFGTGAFCIEAFVQLAGSGTNRAICSFMSNWTLYVASAGGILYFYNGSSNILNAGAFSTGVRRHVALTRDGSSNLRLFVDGALAASTTFTGNINSTNFRWGAATGVSPSSFYNGLIGRRRITKGNARYTSAFTPPSGRFPTA